MKSSENISNNKHTMELANSTHLFKKSTYALNSIQRETLKTYIKTYLKTDYIRPFQFLANNLILFDNKFDGSFYLLVHYQDFNNLSIKNWYLLLLICKLLDWSNLAKQFIRLDSISINHQKKYEKRTSKKPSFILNTVTLSIKLDLLIYLTY